MEQNNEENIKIEKEISEEPPSYMGAIGRSLWRRIVPILKAESAIKLQDRSTIEALCLNYETMRKAYDDINENGAVKAAYRTITNPTNGDIVARDFTGYKRNPSTQIFDSASAKVRSLSKDLGMTPKSRAELLELTPKDGDNPDAIKQLKATFG
ncbi:phage terminase small subunit P27 family [Lentilactobacillus senioris]|uniref:phage terminase small subunit P27 family n=1 Tax=Lentilactobacillus senioris TaxID=931534 RepID=UPI003D284182